MSDITFFDSLVSSVDDHPAGSRARLQSIIYTAWKGTDGRSTQDFMSALNEAIDSQLMAGGTGKREAGVDEALQFLKNAGDRPAWQIGNMAIDIIVEASIDKH